MAISLLSCKRRIGWSPNPLTNRFLFRAAVFLRERPNKHKKARKLFAMNSQAMAAETQTAFPSGAAGAFKASAQRWTEADMATFRAFIVAASHPDITAFYERLETVEDL